MMKVPFFKRISTKLLFFPLLFILVLFAALALGFYFLSPKNPFEDFYRQHLVNLSSEKKLVVDTWFEQCKKSTEYLVKNETVKEAVLSDTAAASATDKRRKKTLDSASGLAQAASLRLLDDMVLSSPCKIFALLLKDGKIISSSQRELIGSNWSDRDFFASAITELKYPSVRVFYSVDSGMVFLSPVFDDRESLIGLIYAVPNNDKLARLLHVEGAVYKTEKVEMIDKEGNLMLTQKGFPDKRMKYNVPKEGKGNAVELKDNLYFHVVSLDNAPFRLVATVEKAEVDQPFIIVLVLCAVFAGFVFIVLVYQSAWNGPKFISKPVDSFISAAKAAADGIFGNINFGKNCSGELLELKKAFEFLVDELRTKELMQAERLKSAKAMVSTAPYEGISNEFRDPLSSIADAAEVVINSGHQLDEQNTKALYDMLCTSKDLLLFVDNLCDYARFEQGKFEHAAGPFNLCDLLNETELYARSLAGMKEIELIVECQEVFVNSMVHTNRSMLRKLLLNLVSNAMKNTSAGTVTILSTEKIMDGMDYLEVSVADTGRGFSRDELNQLFGDISSPQASVGLIIARKISEILGGSLETESVAGKGSVFTAVIPNSG